MRTKRRRHDSKTTMILCWMLVISVEFCASFLLRQGQSLHCSYPKNSFQVPRQLLNVLSKGFDEQRQEMNNVQYPGRRPPIPTMPSDLFRRMAQSQLELLANSLTSNSNPLQSKGQSMILYLPAENVMTGQLEFTPAVLYPDPNTERVFIASDAESGRAPKLPKTLTKLPGFSHASTLLPGYPMLSSTDQPSPGVGVVEEVMCDIRFKTAALSVPLLSGSQTVGVLLVSPAVDISDAEIQWTSQDREQVSRAAQSLSMALMMDNERSYLKEQNTAFREGLSDSLHQVKNPIQALRTYGKILQRQIAETGGLDGTSMRPNESGTPQLLELTHRLIVQSERVVDLLQPMDNLVENMDKPLIFLPEAKNVDSQSMILLNTQQTSVPPLDVQREYFENPSTYSLHHQHRYNQTHLYSTINDINDSAQSETAATTAVNDASSTTMIGDFETEMTFVNDVLDPVFDTFRAIASERGINFQVLLKDDGDDLPGVMAAPKSLQEAVSNILDNAFKYVVLAKEGVSFTKNPSPKVIVRILPNDEEFRKKPGVTVLIEDNGPGIPGSDQDKIFQRGFRSTSTSTAVNGKGIGLDIAKALIDRMGGSLELVNDRDDKFNDSLDGTVLMLQVYRKP